MSVLNIYSIILVSETSNSVKIINCMIIIFDANYNTMISLKMKKITSKR